MAGNKEKYDLICSLGGNCAAAHNLQYRNMRFFSLPFDWTYFISDAAVYKLADGFKNNFKNYALKNFLNELPVNPNHPDRIQYEDTYGKIIWANHFIYDENREQGYYRVKEILDRRFERLISAVERSKKIIFIFSVSFSIKPDAFIHLSSTLNKLYPDKDIKIRVLSFNSENDCIYENSNVTICYYQRKINDTDFSKTNKEWDFLNTIKLTNTTLYRIKHNILKLLITLLPRKSLCKRLRKKYHVRSSYFCGHSRV